MCYGKGHSVQLVYYIFLHYLHQFIKWYLYFKNFHIPKILTELMYITYRYLFILIEIQHQIKIAAISRLGYCDIKTSLKTFSSCIANLFILSLKKHKNIIKLWKQDVTQENYFLQEKQYYNKTTTIKAILYILSILLLKIVLRGQAL